MLYAIYVEAKDQSIRLYWNKILDAWVKTKRNATPYTLEEIRFKLTESPFKFQYEVLERI